MLCLILNNYPQLLWNFSRFSPFWGLFFFDSFLDRCHNFSDTCIIILLLNHFKMSSSNSTQIFSTHAICADSFYAARVLGCGWASRYLFTFLLLDVRSFCKVERVDRFLLLGLSEIIAFFLLVIAASKADTHSRCPLCTWPLSTRVSPVWCLYFPLLLLFNHCCAILFPTLWIAACQASLSFTVSQSLLRLMSFELVMPSNHLVLCHPLLLPSMFLSIRVFCSESALVSGGQSIGASALALVLPMNIQG